MSEIRFRAASKSDLPTIIQMLADDPLGQTRETLSEPLDARYVAAFEALEADPNHLMIVADRKGVVVGCLQLSFMPGLSHTGMWRGQIENVRVASEERGSGLGKAMIGWAVDCCRERGCGMVQLTADKSRHGAHRFYEQLGFDARHEGFKLNL
jgi:ribosomal protein S18 acetylase RimI-like enzyme